MDELAQSLGIGAEMVEAWELGDATPNANQMAVLTNALDMRLPALMQSPKAHAGEPAPERSRELEALRQRLAGGLLRCAREDNGASIGQLSAATGIDSEVLSAIELGERALTPGETQELAAALERDIAYFAATKDEGMSAASRDTPGSTADARSYAANENESRAMQDLKRALQQLPKPQLKGIAEALLAVAESKSNANGA